MLDKNRIVLDTNTIISAAFWENSTPRKVFNFVRKNRQLIFSYATYTELEKVLMRPKFDRYASLEVRTAILKELYTIGSHVAIDRKIEVCRDPKDDKFLEVAIASNCSMVVSGDNDLLTLHPFEEINIFTPAQYLIKFV